jgi:uncharacterized repeat protein (TIGR01451 family)
VAGTPNAKGSWVGTAGAALNPLLEGLADNGGTFLLPDGSHLLTHQDDANNGNNGVRGRGPQGLPFDERDFPVGNTARDIGAFQFLDVDVSVAATAPAGTVRVGQPATFTFAVTNNGPGSAQLDYTLYNSLPAGTTFVSGSGNVSFSGNIATFLVPIISIGQSASFTLTVIPEASGPFNVTAAVAPQSDDPNRANNGASATITVLPAAVPATGSADVTDLVKLVPLVGRHRRPQKRLFFLLTNDSSMPIQGPMGVVVPGLRPRRGPKLLDASGTTAGGQKYVQVNLGGDDICDPGASTMVELVFSQPFTPRKLNVLAGTLA